MYFKPESKGRQNFFLVFFAIFPVKPSKVAVFFTLSPLKNDFSNKEWVKYCQKQVKLGKIFNLFHVLTNFFLAFETDLLLRPNLGASHDATDAPSHTSMRVVDIPSTSDILISLAFSPGRCWECYGAAPFGRFQKARPRDPKIPPPQLHRGKFGHRCRRRGQRWQRSQSDQQSGKTLSQPFFYSQITLTLSRITASLM